MGKLTFNIVTPDGVIGPIDCDSVHITICDDASGKGGGSYGIRANSAKTLFALDCGEIKALLNGETIILGEGGTGFATVENNTVTAVIESFKKTE